MFELSVAYQNGTYTSSYLQIPMSAQQDDPRMAQISNYGTPSASDIDKSKFYNGLVWMVKVNGTDAGLYTYGGISNDYTSYYYYFTNPETNTKKKLTATTDTVNHTVTFAITTI